MRSLSGASTFKAQTADGRTTEEAVRPERETSKSINIMEAKKV